MNELLVSHLDRDSDSAKALLATIDWLYWKNPAERPYALRNLQSIMEEIEDYISGHPLGKFIVLDAEETEQELNRKYIFVDYDGEKWAIPRPPILTAVIKRDGWSMTVIEDQDERKGKALHRFVCKIRKPHELSTSSEFWAEGEPDYEEAFEELKRKSEAEKAKLEK